MSFRNKYLLAGPALLLGLMMNSQTASYNWPIDSPRVITGNYGELRPNHFHTGLDFSTNGRINYPVYAISDGYVSRIKVSSEGYGKCVYVTHPDGKTSVYGHLNSFNEQIAPLVKKEQYSKQSYDVEIYPKPGDIVIKKKQQLGLSGNSGGSTGPHLHFELRDTQSEIPLNPMEFFNVQDNIPPMLESVAFYNLADTCSPKFLCAFKVKKGKKDSLYVEKDSIILNQGILGFAFSGYDQYLPKGNPNNIFGAKVYLDNHLLYGHTLDNISFDDVRFVNEFSDEVEKFKYQKCFMPTLYPPNIYDRRPTKGRILLSDTNFHQLKLSVIDENANERVLVLTFKTRQLNFFGAPSINSDVFVDCTSDFMISKNKLQIFIPANTLFYSTGLIFENTLETTGKIIILPTEANLKSTSIIGFEVPRKYKRNKSKLVLKSGGVVLSPIVTNDSVFYSVKNFGGFLIDQDTVAPKVKASESQTKHNSFSFQVSDNLSGLYKYNLYIDDKWVLGEYDAKQDMVTYNFDEDTPKGPLNFRLEAEDKVHNQAVLKYTLKR